MAHWGWPGSGWSLAWLEPRLGLSLARLWLIVATCCTSNGTGEKGGGAHGNPAGANGDGGAGTVADEPVLPWKRREHLRKRSVEGNLPVVTGACLPSSVAGGVRGSEEERTAEGFDLTAVARLRRLGLGEGQQRVGRLRGGFYTCTHVELGATGGGNFGGGHGRRATRMSRWRHAGPTRQRRRERESVRAGLLGLLGLARLGFLFFFFVLFLFLFPANLII